MTAPREFLEQLDQAHADAELGGWAALEFRVMTAPDAIPKLTAALRAVLNLHTPVEWHEETEPFSGELDPDKPLTPFCRHCTDDEYVSAVEFGDTIDLGADVVYWPCPTVEAITAALPPAQPQSGNPA